MVLAESVLRERIGDGIRIDPYVPEHVEPASVDLRLGRSFSVMDADGVIDTRDASYDTCERTCDSITLAPGACVLGTTLETIGVPDDLAANVVGRSSLGRLHVVVHKTAGFIDPGFEGEITLEIENDSPNPVRLHAGDRICQIYFQQLAGHVETPYGEQKSSQYHEQYGATSSGMQFGNRSN